MQLKSKFLIGCGLTLLILLSVEQPALAEWSVEGEGNIFYTDDVAIFSATRRLTLREDPTQPVIDVTGQGEDAVFEPLLSLSRSFQPSWGVIELSARAQGFVFAQNPVFNHGTYGLQATQELPSNALLGFRYHYGPNLFLGDNEDRRAEDESLAEERVTTHFWVAEVERRVMENLNLRVLGRYGLRFYNEAFAQRDTRFWTIGSHLEWEVLSWIELMLGYHYERGLADGRNEPELRDDISYVNNYVLVELDIDLTDRTSLRFGFDYERNDFTSGIPEDIHRDGYENIFQGDVEIRHAFTPSMDIAVGYQRGQRKFSFEPSTEFVNNVWVGLEGRFDFEVGTQANN